MKKSMMRNSILFYTLTAISFSALADSVLRSQEFEAYIRSEDVKLTGGQAVVTCHTEKHFNSKVVDYKATGPINVIPSGSNLYKLHIAKVEAVEFQGFPRCSFGIELQGVDSKGKSVKGFYALDGFEPLYKEMKKKREAYDKVKDKYGHEGVELYNEADKADNDLNCSRLLFTDKRMLGDRPCTLKTPEGEDFFKNFYKITQKNLSSLVLKSYDNKIVFGVATSYPDAVYKNLNSLEKDFEAYWRKRRLGVDTEDIISVEKPSKSGAIVGMILGVVLTDSFTGLAVGGVLGNVLDNNHAPKVTTTKKQLPIPFVDTSKILANTEYGFAPANDILISLSLVDLYQKFLKQKRNLTQDEIQELQTLKELFSPKLDKIFTKLLETDYENQGICVRDGNCHLN